MITINKKNEAIAKYHKLKFKKIELDGIYGIWVTDDSEEKIIYNMSDNNDYYTIPYHSDWSFLIESIKKVKEDIESKMKLNFEECNSKNIKNNLEDGDDGYDETYILKNARWEAALYPIIKSLETLNKEEMHNALYEAILY